MKRLLAAVAISFALLFGCSDDSEPIKDAGVDVGTMEAGTDAGTDVSAADIQPVDSAVVDGPEVDTAAEDATLSE